MDFYSERARMVENTLLGKVWRYNHSALNEQMTLTLKRTCQEGYLRLPAYTYSPWPDCWNCGYFQIVINPCIV